eukprot:scaffold20951_cov130-Isochrysis_galbana.AAC.1
MSVAPMSLWSRCVTAPPTVFQLFAVTHECRFEDRQTDATDRQTDTDTRHKPPTPPIPRTPDSRIPSVIVLGARSDDRYVDVGAPSALRLYSPKRLELRFVNQPINQSHSCQSRHILAIIVRLVASQPRSQDFTQSTPSRHSGMVQPVVQEMFATVHAAGSSLLFVVEGALHSPVVFNNNNIYNLTKKNNSARAWRGHDGAAPASAGAHRDGFDH